MVKNNLCLQKWDTVLKKFFYDLNSDAEERFIGLLRQQKIWD